MKADKSKFSKDIENINIICPDSSILIYHLEDIKPYSDLTEMLIMSISCDILKALISTISITELMTKPYSEGDMKKIFIFKRFIQSLPSTEIIPPDFVIAQEAARLRGQYRLKTPDAILLATVIQKGGHAFITNDIHFKKIILDDVKIIFLDDYISKVI